MDERVNPGVPNVRILLHIPVGVELWARVFALRCPLFQVMQHWINASRANIGILAKIPIAIKEFRGAEQSSVSLPSYAMFTALTELKARCLPKESENPSPLTC